MSLYSVLQTVVHGAKQIPAFLNSATHEDNPEFVPKYNDIPAIPYSGQITPDGPTENMDFGGGQGDMIGGEVKHHVSNRPNMWGKILQSAPGIISAGIAGAARPNIAGGGAADVFRAADAGVSSIRDRQDLADTRARQKQQDEYRRQDQLAKIDDRNALAEKRRADAAAVSPAYAVGKFGWVGTDNVWHPAPADATGVDSDKQATNNRLIGNAGGYELPEKQTFDVPTGSPVPGQGTMRSTVSNVPPPEDYHNLPGTSGDHRIVMPSAELKGGLRHPIQEKPTLSDITAERTAAADQQGLVGTNRAAYIANGRISMANPRATAPRKTLQQQVDERTAIAGQHPEWNDQERKIYAANGRLPTGGAGKPKPDASDTMEEFFKTLPGGGDQALSQSRTTTVPAGNPRATPPTPNQSSQKPIPMPPEKAARLQVGQQTPVTGPDGKPWLVIKGADGLVRRLR